MSKPPRVAVAGSTFPSALFTAWPGLQTGDVSLRTKDLASEPRNELDVPPRQTAATEARATTLRQEFDPTERRRLEETCASWVPKNPPRVEEGDGFGTQPRSMFLEADGLGFRTQRGLGTLRELSNDLKNSDWYGDKGGDRSSVETNDPLAEAA